MHLRAKQHIETQRKHELWSSRKRSHQEERWEEDSQLPVSNCGRAIIAACEKICHVLVEEKENRHFNRSKFAQSNPFKTRRHYVIFAIAESPERRRSFTTLKA